MKVSNKEIEGLLLADAGQMECQADPILEYQGQVRRTLKNHKIETTLGTGIIRNITVTPTVLRSLAYHFAVEVEFPREDKTWAFTLYTADTGTMLLRLQRAARKWATTRAEQILRAEDGASAIREIRAAQKMKHDKSLHGLFYFEACDCVECDAHRRGLDERSLELHGNGWDHEGR